MWQIYRSYYRQNSTEVKWFASRTAACGKKQSEQMLAAIREEGYSGRPLNIGYDNGRRSVERVAGRVKVFWGTALGYLLGRGITQ